MAEQFSASVSLEMGLTDEEAAEVWRANLDLVAPDAIVLAVPVRGVPFELDGVSALIYTGLVERP